MGSVKRTREVGKVGGPKAQKLWRLGESEQDLWKNVNARAQMKAREVV
jgi:hypothetical protein